MLNLCADFAVYESAIQLQVAEREINVPICLLNNMHVQIWLRLGK